jgi:hypothetical protein
MKYYTRLFIFLFTVLSCTSNKDSGDIKSDLLKFDAFPLEVTEQNALMTKWENKPVLQTLLVDDMESDRDWDVSGIGEMNYTIDRSKDGKRSLRFSTSLRDEEHYRKNRSEWDSFEGGQGGSSYVQLQFDEPQDWSAYNRISVWVYVHPTSMPTYCIQLQFKCEGAVTNATSYNGSFHFVQDLKTGQWNNVLFEIPHLKRDKVTSFKIHQTLSGHNPEEEGIVTYDIDQIEIQRVVVDQFEGWELGPDKFAFSHVGYRPGEEKIALVSRGAGDEFQLLGKQDKIVYSGNVQVVNNDQGIFQVLDFSDYDKSGEYRLRCGELESNPFPIDDDIWIQPIFKAMNFFWCQRCGYHVPGVHLECHKDWQGFYGDEKKVINGGWHDAGDLSQGSFRTAMSALSMMMNLERIQDQPKYTELADRIRTELAWGLEWLLKTRFGDGYHMSFSVMRIYTDNEVGTIDDVVSPATNVPWENFLAAAVQCKAAGMLQSSHPELAQKSKIAALEDWQAAMDSKEKWDQASYQEAAWGATSSILLGNMTGEEKYKETAIQLGNLVVQCQEQSFVEGIPITGYFYTNTDRDRVIHNQHTAFEEAPLIALGMLCRAFPDHSDWMDWYSAAVLHSEYFMKRGSQIAAPYDLLPNSVWKRSEIMDYEGGRHPVDHKAMLRQFNDGTFLNDDYVLRTFPIYANNLIHGSTNIHMSSTWALAEASRLRKDNEGMKLVGKQFRWIFGANPFGQSLMYGEGYDFAPYFAYCLKDLVGALPVGMDCMSGDEPHWSATNKATYKEIWVEPVNRFLGAVSVYLSEYNNLPDENDSEETIQLISEIIPLDNNAVKVEVTATGSGTHELRFNSFNADIEIGKKEITLTKGNSEKMDFEMSIIDPGKPYVVVIFADQNPQQRWEVVGALVEAEF